MVELEPSDVASAALVGARVAVRRRDAIEVRRRAATRRAVSDASPALTTSPRSTPEPVGQGCEGAGGAPSTSKKRSSA